MRPPRPSGRASASSSKSRAGRTHQDRFEEPALERSGTLAVPTSEAQSAEAGLGRAQLQVREDIGRLEKDLGKLLELFAASESEARVWARLLEHRKRLEGARRRLNRVRRRRAQLSKLWRGARPTPDLEALALSLERLSSDGERFDQIFAQLAALLDAPVPEGEPRVAHRNRRARAFAEDGGPIPPSALLAELAQAMIDLLRHGDAEP